MIALSNTINVLESIYYLDNKKIKILPEKKIDKKRKLIVLILSCITKHCPEMNNISERKFMKFQDELFNLLNKNISIEDIK